MSSLSPLSNDDDKKHFAETQHVERTMSVDTDCDTIKTGGDSKHLANLPTIIEGKTGDAAVELLQGERVVLTDEQVRPSSVSCLFGQWINVSLRETESHDM